MTCSYSIKLDSPINEAIKTKLKYKKIRNQWHIKQKLHKIKKSVIEKKIWLPLVITLCMLAEKNKDDSWEKYLV